jgi:UDP-N-acetylglucosamine 4-epimerase
MMPSRYRQVLDELTRFPRVWLVTGVAGFVGSSILEQLLALGQSVLGLDNFSTGREANLEEVLAAHPASAGSFQLIRGDIRDLDTCRDACAGVDIVLHQAGLGSVQQSMQDPATANAVNVTGFLNVLIAARDAAVRRFVYASSSAVYGDSTDLPQLEHSLGAPLSPLAVMSCADELYASVFQRAFGLESVGLRYFSVFGQRQDPSGEYAAVIPCWIDSLLRSDRCRIFGDGQSARDFCYVGNVVQANLLAAMAPTSATNDVYNVACGESTTLNELYRMIRLGLAGFTRTIAADPLYHGSRSGELRSSLASIEKTRQRLGYEPSHSVSQGLGEAIGWYVSTRSPELPLPRISIPDGALLEGVG